MKLLYRDWVFHDSHQLFYRNPFGAVECDTKIILRLKIICSQEPESVIIRIWQGNSRSRDMKMDLYSHNQEERIYQTEIQASFFPGLLWYYFVVVKEGKAFYYGNNRQRWGGVGNLEECIPPSYQITVYKQGFTTPNWLKEGVMYQIFVDRFYNGIDDGTVLNPKKDSLIHGNWDDAPLYLRNCEDGSILRWDFFGGNLLGVIKKLPYLKELGISVIYLNPIFLAPSNHKYDTGDYGKVDPMFGSQETFQLLCEEAGKLGIKIILDGVFSHTGSDSKYFNKEGTYETVGAFQSPDSPYYNWYRFYEFPDKYECWWGIDTLPNVKELEPTYQEFILGEEGIVKYWMEKGAKGWRLDVADELPDEFIKKMRARMKEYDPNSFLLGEVWEDASNKVSYGKNRGFLWGEELDSVMNYPFRLAVLEFLLGRYDANEINRALMSLSENYPRPCFYALMNLLGSHDVPRILTLLGEGIPEGKLPEKKRGYQRLSPNKRSLGIARLKLAGLLQMTFPGVPCIYYGDEAGLEGYSDPYNRGTYPWGKENKEILAWYKKLIAIRNQHVVFRQGAWEPLYAAGDVFGYLRYLQKDTAVVFINRSTVKEYKIRVNLKEGRKETWLDIFHNQRFQIKQGLMELSLQPLEGKILLKATNM